MFGLKGLLMRILNSDFSLESFFERLKVEQSLLLLDYDGTLAPFHVDPAKAVPYPGVIGLLEKILESTRTRLVIISGRAIDSLLPLLPLSSLPEIWGCHGGERQTAQKRSTQLLSEKQQQGVCIVQELVRKTASENRCEIKPLSIAVHWRGCSETEIERVIQSLQFECDLYDLERHEFDGGIEFRAPGVDKGGAIETLLQEVGPNCPVAYAGDDATDEHAFEALGDRGLKILVRKEIRPTLADIQLEPPGALLEFLERWALAVTS